MRPIAILLVVVLVASCEKKPTPRQHLPDKPRAPAVLTTLALPGEEGSVHVIDVPSANRFQASRCVVAVSRSGHVSAACAPPEIDLP